MVRDRHRASIGAVSPILRRRRILRRLVSSIAGALGVTTWLACGPGTVVIGIPYGQREAGQAGSDQVLRDGDSDGAMAGDSGSVGGYRAADAQPIPDATSGNPQADSGLRDARGGGSGDVAPADGPSELGPDADRSDGGLDDTGSDSSADDGSSPARDSASPPENPENDDSGGDGSEDGSHALPPNCSSSCPPRCENGTVCGAACEDEGATCISEVGEVTVCAASHWACFGATPDSQDCAVFCIGLISDN